MTTKEGSQLVSNSAWIILDYALHGGPSGLDEDTITWSRSAVKELARAAHSIRTPADFGKELAGLMSTSRREVSLLAVELFALNLLPLSFANGTQSDCFRRLVSTVAGEPVIVPEALLAGIEGPGYRSMGSDDNVSQRFMWLLKYVEICGTCPDYEWLVASGNSEYLGHEDLHDRCLFDFVTESPWACAEFSALVENDEPLMRYDLDHMLWPEELAPAHIRRDAIRILRDHVDLLRGSYGTTEVAIVKDLFLLKQLLGSWDNVSALGH